MINAWALVTVYALGAALFVAGCLSPHTWILAAGVVLVASGIAIENGGTER